jgi:sugar lactone lactonase YvrE
MDTLFSLCRALTARLARLRDNGRNLKPFASTLAPLPFVLLALLGIAPNAAHANEGPSVVFSGVMQTLITGLSGRSGVAFDSHGNLYIADTFNNKVEEVLAVNGVVPANPTFIVLGSGFKYPFGLTVDASGNVFVADYGNFAVKEILAVEGAIPSSPTIRTLGSGFGAPSSVAVDASGDVFVADFGGNAIKEIVAVDGSIPSSNPTITTLPGIDTYYPLGVALDASGNLYVADTYNSQIKEILAVNGSIPSSNLTVNVLGSGFSYPQGLAVDANGNVFVADTYNNEIKEILAVNGSIPASNPTINVLGSGFSSPEGVALGSGGEVFVVNYNQGTDIDTIMPEIANFAPAAIATGTPQTLQLTFTFTQDLIVPYFYPVFTQGAAGLDFAFGSTTCTSDPYFQGDTCTVDVTFTPTASGPRYGAAVLTDSSHNTLATAPLFGIGTGPQVTFSPGTETQLGGSYLTAPFGVALDAKGNLYVADNGGAAVVEFTAASSYGTGTTLSTSFSQPSGIAIDGSGNLFVSDNQANVVKEILAVNGSIPSNPTVNVIASGFSFPYGVALDQYGNVFVADSGHDAVKEILAAGGYTTVNTLGSGFKTPCGVAVDASGNVFVADFDNGAIKEILAVNGSIPANPTINTLATGIETPFDVSVDGNENVYIANAYSGSIQKILAVGGYTTVQTLATNFAFPVGTALDSKGDVFVADGGSTIVGELNYSAVPSLTFASTAVGSSSPQTVTVTNYGNAPLSFPKPSSGLNPSVPAGFDIDSSSTCPNVSPSSSAGSLAANTFCTLIVDFTPSVPGIQSGFVSITDNALNTSAPTYTHQTFEVTGTGTQSTPPSKITPTIKVTSSANPSTVGSAVTLEAKLTGPSNAPTVKDGSKDGSTTGGNVALSVGTPTGTAEFKDGSTELGNVEITNGTASYTTSALAVGTHSITVVYNGDSYFNTVTSSVLSQVVQSSDTTAGISLNFGSSTSSQTASNGTATYLVNIAPVGSTTFANKVTYTLSTLPSGWTATFSPTSIAAGSGDTTVTITLKDGGSAALSPSMFNASSVYPVALGLLLLPFSGRLRRISKRWSQLACLLLLVTGGAAIVSGVSGCGGSSTPQTTYYAMTLKATSGSLSQSTTLDLTVK